MCAFGLLHVHKSICCICIAQTHGRHCTQLEPKEAALNSAAAAELRQLERRYTVNRALLPEHSLAIAVISRLAASFVTRLHNNAASVAELAATNSVFTDEVSCPDV